MERRYLLKAMFATSMVSCLPAMSYAANKSTKKVTAPESFGLERLKSTHIKAMGLLSGDKSVLNVVFIGDSWTHLTGIQVCWRNISLQNTGMLVLDGLVLALLTDLDTLLLTDVPEIKNA